MASAVIVAPSEHEALDEAWGNVGPASQTLGQRLPAFDSMSPVCWVSFMCHLFLVSYKVSAHLSNSPSTLSARGPTLDVRI